MKKESNVIKEDKRLNTLMEIEEYCKWEDFKEGDRIPVSSPSPNIPDTLKIKESVMTEVDNIMGVVEENRKKCRPIWYDIRTRTYSHSIILFRRN